MVVGNRSNNIETYTYWLNSADRMGPLYLVTLNDIPEGEFITPEGNYEIVSTKLLFILMKMSPSLIDIKYVR